jgi:hypothetical protein
MSCARERAPLVVKSTWTAGWRSGRSRCPRVWHGRPRLAIPAGDDREASPGIVVRLRDRAGTEAFDYRGATTVQLRPAQILVIDFQSALGTITFR